jgi:hypothetical protein
MNTEQRKKILHNAPYGATHYSPPNDQYIMQSKSGTMVYSNGEWEYDIVCYAGAHKLSDLHDVVLMEYENKNLIEQADEAIKRFNFITNLILNGFEEEGVGLHVVRDRLLKYLEEEYECT